MNIRPFVESDEASVIALWHACDRTRPWNDPQKHIARKLTVRHDLFFVGAQERPKVNLLVSSPNSGVVGFYRSLGYAVGEAVAMDERLIADEPK